MILCCLRKFYTELLVYLTKTISYLFYGFSCTYLMKQFPQNTCSTMCNYYKRNEAIKSLTNINQRPANLGVGIFCNYQNPVLCRQTLSYARKYLSHQAIENGPPPNYLGDSEYPTCGIIKVFLGTKNKLRYYYFITAPEPEGEMQIFALKRLTLTVNKFTKRLISNFLRPSTDDFLTSM